MQLPLTVNACAKVNLCLYVGERRQSDGMHEIASLFQSIDLADELRFEWSESEADELVCPQVGADNLVGSALVAFRAASKWDGAPIRITIEKKIPIAAGLGGGSADAAATLATLNKVAGRPLSNSALTALAATLGADLPFALDPGFALVTGVGELINPLTALSPFGLVLIPQPEGLATAGVYSAFDRTQAPCEDLEGKARLLAEINSVEQLSGHINELQPAALELMPQIDSALAALEQAGAIFARVTGSGPMAFGVFTSPEEASRAARDLEGFGALACDPLPGTT